MVPWQESGQWLWEHLPGNGISGDILCAAPKPGSFLDKYKILPPYLREFWHLSAGKVALEEYDVVFAWELRTAITVALLRKMRSKNKRFRFVVVGPILKGQVLRVLPLIGWLLRSAERIVCFSRAECETQARLLRLPRSKFVFVPTAWKNEEIASVPEQGYVLALGHSGRDYPTLLEAVRETDLPLILAIKDLADLRGVPLPPGVTVRYRTEQRETETLVAGAAFLVLPLQDANYSAGQSVLLRAMSAGKAVIVSDTAGIRDYVENGETAVLVPPGDTQALRAALLHLWDNADERQRIGSDAALSQRENFSFSCLTKKLVRVAEEIL